MLVSIEKINLLKDMELYSFFKCREKIKVITNFSLIV